jgi:deazaflavin-dependent oxidoreductase (nitroreductase family)
MAFDTPNGTRGARQPGRNRLERWANLRMAEHVRRTGTRRGDILVLVTVGKRSGLERMTPVRWFPDPGHDDGPEAGRGDGGDGDGDTRLIVASADGAARNPSWYYNIAAHPDRVRIEFAGRRIEVIPEQLHGAERDAAWRRITARARGFAKYEQTTDRQIPVIRLTPRAGG